MASAEAPAIIRVCQNLLKAKQFKSLSACHSASTAGPSRSQASKAVINFSGIGRCLYSTAANHNRMIYKENGETIIRSHYEDVENVDASFGEFVFSCLDLYKDLELMVNSTTGETFTGAGMKDAAIRVASGLWKLGYRKGDVVIAFSPNCPEYTILMLACSILGMPVATSNPAYTAAELEHQLAHTDAKAVVTVEALIPVVKKAIGSSQQLTSNNKHIFTFHSSSDGCYPFSLLMGDDGKEFPENVDIAPDNDVLFMPYSSGTTGLPKGVMLTHTNLVMNLIQMRGPLRTRAGEDVLVGLLPFFHIYGIAILQFGSLTQGSKIVTLPKFELETFLTTIQKYKISLLHLVPPLVLLLAKSPVSEGYDLTSVKKIISGAAPLGEGITREAEAKLGAGVCQGYGLTECGLSHCDEMPYKTGTVGRLIPSTRGKIIDIDTGRTLEAGESGELLIKGPQVMKGYLKNQEATDASIKDGWLHTGDICQVDSEGYFTITDRLKEMIKYKAFAVAPAELEALLCTHPAIQDAAVIGVPAGEGVGEVPRAFVVARPGVAVKEDDVIDFVANNVAPYKKLRGGVKFVEEIPKTPSGKILRKMFKK